MSTTPIWVSIAQVSAAFLSPIIAAFTAISTLRWKDRDSLVGSVDWAFDYDPDHGEIEYPFLMVQNRSSHSIHVTSLEFRRGVFYRTSDGQTALDYEDPLDLRFPYEIEPGKSRKFALDSIQAARLYDKDRFIDRVSNILRRRPFIVLVRTMGGSNKGFDAIRSIPFSGRPGWAQ